MDLLTYFLPSILTQGSPASNDSPGARLLRPSISLSLSRAQVRWWSLERDAPILDRAFFGAGGVPPLAAIVQRWEGLTLVPMGPDLARPVNHDKATRFLAGEVGSSCDCKSDSVTLSSPRAADDELGLASSGGAEQGAAVFALDSCLRVRENSRNFVALLADHVHEKGVRCLYQSLKFVQMLLLGRIGIQKVHLHCAL